jgi:hypothetical protein
MLAADLVVGRAYAERAKPNDAVCVLRKIIFVGPARAGKAKIRHADGDLDELEEWVPARTLRCAAVAANRFSVARPGLPAVRANSRVLSTNLTVQHCDSPTSTAGLPGISGLLPDVPVG